MKRRPIWCAAYLVVLEEVNGRSTIAADRVGVDHKQVKRLEARDPSFMQDVDAVYHRLEQKLIETVRLRPQSRKSA